MPSLVKSAEGKMHQEAKAKDRETREKQKEVFDKRKRAVLKDIKSGDQVLIKQQKSTVNPPYDPKPFTVTKVKSAQVTAERGSTTRVRDMSKVKLVVPRPIHLRTRRQEERRQDSDSEDDDDDFNLDAILGRGQPQEQEVDVQVQVQPQMEEQEEEYPHLEGVQTPARRVRKAPRRYSPPSWYASYGMEDPSYKQPSPQQRKRAQGAAKYKKKPGTSSLARSEGAKQPGESRHLCSNLRTKN